MATENIQKGWLYTRDGDKFAPETLVENVTTRSGKPYDERVREYLNSLNTSLTTKINSIKTDVESSGKDYGSAISALQAKDVQLDADITALETKLQYFDGSASDKLYIVDNSNKIVAYVDGTGVHSIDFLIGIENKSIAEQLQWFDGSSGSEFFFIDNSNNVVAFIDGNGIHSTEYIHKDGTTFSWVLDKIRAFDNELQWFAPDENNEAFYIIDNSNNVAAKVDGFGIDAIDFKAKGQDYSLVGLNSAVKTNIENIGKNKSAIESNDADILALQNRATELETAHDTMEDNLEEYYGYNNFGQDTFYFIDSSTIPKVGTMVNGAGITTTNITFANEKNAKENMMFFEKLGTIDIQI